MMEQLELIMTCLKELNYPIVNSMNEEEIMAIFATSNREFFISWVLKQLDEEYETALVNCTKEDLADIVHDYGFCTKNQKLKFMYGELSPEEQFEIIYRMLKFAKDVTPKTCPLIEGTTSMQTITELQEMNINVFPGLGAQKHLTQEDRLVKIKEYNEEIRHLEQLLALNEPEQSVDTAFLNSNHKNELMRRLQSFSQKLPEFNSQILKILQLKQNCDKSDFKLDSNYEELLCHCRENVIRTKKLIENVYTITNIQENYVPDLVFDDSNARIRSLFQELSKLSIEINSGAE